MSLIYKDDVNTNLVIATSNLSLPELDTGVNVLKLNIEKPSGLTVEVSLTPSMVDRATGIITYPTVLGDLSEVGEYRVQVHGTFSDGTNSVSDIDSFQVFAKIEV